MRLCMIQCPYHYIKMSYGIGYQPAIDFHYCTKLMNRIHFDDRIDTDTRNYCIADAYGLLVEYSTQEVEDE